MKRTTILKKNKPAFKIVDARRQAGIFLPCSKFLYINLKFIKFSFSGKSKLNHF
jgi:hypothetical protein